MSLYGTDKEFEKVIDPKQVIVLRKPADDRYSALLVQVYVHVGGSGAANGPGKSVQFIHGTK